MNDLKSMNIPYNYRPNPRKVNILQPIIIMRRPAKYTRLLVNFDFLVKNETVFFGPIRATTPMRNEKLAMMRKPRSRNIMRLSSRHATPIKIRATPIFVSCAFVYDENIFVV